MTNKSTANQPVALDTSAILRWILKDIPAQSHQVATILQQYQSVHLSDLAITEAVFVLEKIYHLPRPLIAGHLTSIITQGQINCNRQLLSQVIPLYIQHPKLSFNDCALSIYADINQTLPLLTFDKTLANQLPQAALIQ